MTQLVPSILATSVDDLVRDTERVISLSSLINFDVADGRFVPTRTPAPDEYPRLPVGVRVFWHLMVEEPIESLEACLNVPTALLAIHAEAKGVGEALRRLAERDVPAGLTLSPATQPAEIVPLLDRVQFVQVMTVEPGRQGQPFQPELLSKISQLRSLAPSLDIVVDGGANRATIESIARYRPEYVAVGSALVQVEDPVEEYRLLERLVASAQG